MEAPIKLTPKVCDDDDIEPTYPHYRRLTFISVDSCDFCSNVEKPGPYMYYMSFETKHGWVSCSNEACKQKGEAAVDHFMRTQAYGKANRLRGKSIRVQRTSGQFESTWKLSTLCTETNTDKNGVERVCVVNEAGEIEKWVSVSNLLEWNTE